MNRQRTPHGRRPHPPRRPGRSAGVAAVAATVVGGTLALAGPAAAAPVTAAPVAAAPLMAASLAAAAGSGTTAVDDAVTAGSDRFAYTGAWQVCRGCRSDTVAGAFHYTNRRGATARLTFTGTGAVLVGLRQRAGGIATLTLDGRPAGSVNLAAPRSSVAAVYATPVLRPGVHVLTVTVSGRTTGTGRTVGIDGARVTSTAAAPPPVAPAPAPAPAPPVVAPPVRPASGGVASVTLDDGQLGQFTNAEPVLRAAGLPATFYVISDGLGWGGSSMTADQVRQLAAAGNEIGDHTRDHPHLTGLTADQVRAEFADSVAALRSRTGVTPTTCAYPYGDTDATVQAIAATYFAACRGTNGGTNPAGAASYDLKVFYVHSSTSAADVRAAADAAKAAGSWVIFVYHGVGTGGTGDDVSTAQFGDQIAALKASGIAVRTVAQAAAGR